MNRQEQLRELLVKYGLSEDYSLRATMKFKRNNPEAYDSFISEVRQITGRKPMTSEERFFMIQQVNKEAGLE